VEVGVTHLPRTAGTARGAKPRVILRALGEVWRMYPQLSRLAPGQPPAGSDSVPTLSSSLDVDRKPDLDREEAAV